MASMTVQDAEKIYAKAAEAEHKKDWNNAFQLYLKAAERFLALTRTALDVPVKEHCRLNARRAVERAEKIKSVRRDLAPVSIDYFSEQEQSYVLTKSSQIHNIRYPIWSESFERWRSHVLFEDPDGQPELSAEQQAHSSVWLRPLDVLPNAAMSSIRLLPSDIIQHIVNDCSLCASVAVCLEYNNRFQTKLLLSSIFPQNTESMPVLSPESRYHIRMFFNGAYRRVMVDDKLPFDHNGILMGMVAREHQLWPSIVEKAFMKVSGGYNFLGSNSGSDIHALIGWIPEHMAIKSPTFEKEKSWCHIFDGFANGRCMLTVGTDEQVNLQHLVLLPSHDYAVIDLREVEGQRWVTILDSRVSSTPLRENMAPRKDLTLQVLWDDMCRIFEGIYVSWNPDPFPHKLDFHGMWRRKNIQDEAFGTLTETHHHLRLLFGSSDSISGSQEIWVLLTRHLVDSRRTSEYISLNVNEEHNASIAVHANRLASSGTYTNGPHVLVRTQVDHQPGSLSILPSYDGPSEDVCFTITVYSALSLSWDTHIPRPPYTTKLEGTFSSKNAGGNHTYPTYMDNPQYHLRIPAQQTGRSASVKTNIVFSAQSSRDIPLNITVVWSNGDRAVELANKQIAVNSGPYNYGFARVSADLPAGDYTLILSVFEPDHLGPYVLQLESANPVVTKLIPPEGAGMYHKTLRGKWNASNCAGSPSHGKYASNPIYEVNVPSMTQLKARLQLINPSPSAAINVSLFRHAKWDRCLATSGPYSDVASGVDFPQISLVPGKYWLVLSTWKPGIQAAFRLIVYTSAPGVTTTPKGDA